MKHPESNPAVAQPSGHSLESSAARRQNAISARHRHRRRILRVGPSGDSGRHRQSRNAEAAQSAADAALLKQALAIRERLSQRTVRRHDSREKD